MTTGYDLFDVCYHCLLQFDNDLCDINNVWEGSTSQANIQFSCGRTLNGLVFLFPLNRLDLIISMGRSCRFRTITIS